MVSRVDEDAVVEKARATHGALEPADVALLLARAKAEDVATTLLAAVAGSDGAPADPSSSLESASAAGESTSNPAVIVGCDSVLELGGEIHGKPTDAAQAIKRWQQMRGRSGVLHTGHWLIDARDEDDGGTGGAVGAAAATTVHFARLSDAEIRAYVETGEPLHVAGAFTIDGLGGAFVTSIEGDHHNVVGLSLPVLRDLLGELGIGWFEVVGD